MPVNYLTLHGRHDIQTVLVFMKKEHVSILLADKCTCTAPNIMCTHIGQ